jgi:DNA-directed RNA polymerase specialized sigma24 family protein
MPIFILSHQHRPEECRIAIAAAARRPFTVPTPEMDFGAPGDGPAVLAPRDLIAAIAAAPERYRDAVVAIDVQGLSYEQAARRLRTTTGTINSRLFRGRVHVARVLDARASA